MMELTGQVIFDAVILIAGFLAAWGLHSYIYFVRSNRCRHEADTGKIRG